MSNTRLLQADKHKPSLNQYQIQKAGNIYNLTSGDRPLTFPQIMDLRSQGMDDTVMDSIKRGQAYDLANVGVSAVMIVNHKGNRYLALVGNEQDDVHHTKLLSGYIDYNNRHEPLTQIRTEIAEELLPHIDGKVVKTRFGKDILEVPYNLEEADKITTTKRPGSVHIPAIDYSMGVTLHDSRLSKGPGKAPKFYLHAPTNSGQLVYTFEVEVPPQVNSFNHAEDKFEQGKLNTYLHPAGIYLVELDDNSDLTDKVSTVQGSKKTEINPQKIVLSEAFLPHENGFVTKRGPITLEDFLSS